ncbi:MAG: glycosyltransferase [Anaerolineales bacterium]
MKITILTYGSQGDVEPFAALAQGLLQAGFQVKLAAPEYYRSRFDVQGLEFVGLPGEPAHLVQELVDRAGMNGLRMVREMGRFVLPLADQVLIQSRAACADADGIIHSFLFTSTGLSLGEELGIPTFSAQLFPVFSPTSEFTAPTFPDLPLGGGYRVLTHKAVSLIFKGGSRMLYAWLRMKNPHLPRLPRWIPDERRGGSTPILYGFSSQVVPRPQDWPDQARITGYWLLDERDERAPGKEIEDFLRSGPPPITIAFGSTVTRKSQTIYQTILKALDACNQRGIIVADKIHLPHASQDVLQVDYAPYRWLFNRSAAVIHHGGAGTTGRGLMAGVPNIILPFTSDQPFWGNRVYQLGLGPRPIPVKKLSLDRLSEAVLTVIQDAGMRDRAQAIGEKLREEDGVSQAVAFIQESLQNQIG